jgi:Mn2+/Fe2+ NRAMP family transporter
MLTTLLAALDIGGRHIASIWQETWGKPGHDAFDRTYRIAIPVLVACTGGVLFVFTASFTTMLDFAISASFIGAPIIATLNHLVVTRCSMPEAARPTQIIRMLNLIGIAIMAALAAAFFLL